MDIVKQLIESIKSSLTNKMFWVGVLVCFAMFSHYILGPDNLIEQFGEKQAKDILDIDVDFSANDKNQCGNK